MSFGIKITNDSGLVQLDDARSTIQFISKGVISSWTVDSYALSSRIKYATVVYNGSSHSTPILALRPPLAASTSYQQLVGGVVGVTRVGDQFTFTVAISGQQVVSEAVSLPWYIFDRPPRLTSGHGGQIFDAAGNPVWNTNVERTMQVVGTLGMNAGGEINNLPSNRTYAVVTTTYPNILYQDFGWPAPITSIYCVVGAHLVNYGAKVTAVGQLAYDVSNGPNVMTGSAPGGNTPPSTSIFYQRYIGHGDSPGGSLILDVTGL